MGLGIRAAVKSHLRAVLRHDERMIAKAMEKPGPYKLHIGCGTNILPGWINCDLTPKAPSVVRLDATKVYPVPPSSIDYIFTEHFIEHITYSQGRAMLEECYRVLRPGGKIRVTTPDLAFLISLYGRSKTELQSNYIQWAANAFTPYAPAARDTFVINNFFTCDWGHQFIYDRTAMSELLSNIGFKDITEWDLGKSKDPDLQNLEHVGRMPPGFLQLESMTFEGTK